MDVSRLLRSLIVAVPLAASAAAFAAGAAAPAESGPAADPASLAAPLPPSARKAFFGDLHLHTTLSLDAVWAGVTTTPRDAYRYARGETVQYYGEPVRRKAPLDFLAVSDHAEYLGVSRQVLSRAPPFEQSNWFAELSKADRSGLMRLMRSGLRGTESIPELNDERLRRGNWQAVVDVANEFNEPGRFTTFPAFEWSETPGGAHFHRVMVFRGPQFPDVAFSALDSRHPEDLWRYADAARARGIESVLIPHNANLSNGLQFALSDSRGRPIDRAFAETKARNEPLVEITQNKGTSETRPELSPTDEFAGFELLEHRPENGSAPVLAGSFVRDGYRRGLRLAAEVGVNPYAFGLVGSSDYHSATSATEEDNYTGALGDSDLPRGDNLRRMFTEPNPLLRVPAAALSASGVTGVWAERNTRESVFDAFRRREVFATSGPRMQVRLFAGHDYPAGISRRRDWVTRAYAAGVPMGARLARGATSRAPRFVVQALKDADGANLDRVQIIKVWRAGGRDEERIHDVAWSGSRRVDARTGRLPAVGSTVDLSKATYTNAIGAVQLLAEWVDPDFDPSVAAVYYARVLEIPTPRWTTYLAVRNGLPLPESVPGAIQERAWSSPVFYEP